jgi:uncharacterized protein involved in exopolysaccharide biosynthesis
VRQRVDPVVTAEAGNPVMSSDMITEDDMNTEVELIKSDDVLRPVVLKTGLDKKESTRLLFFPRKPEDAIAKALANLKGSLRVEPLPKTHVLKVTYPSTHPTEAAHVLEVLDQVYLDKHRELHHPPGQFAFFDQQTKQALQDLESAEAKLKAFPRSNGTPNPAVDRDIALQKVNDFNYALGQTRTDMAEAQQRMATLEQMQKTTDPRQVAQEHKGEDVAMKDMKATLLNLELKRSDMASKYASDYPPLVELDREIARTKDSISANSTVSEVTTDRNPTYQWMVDEQAKAKAQIKGDEARIQELESVISQTMDSVRKLDASSVDLQDLTRAMKSAEDNYLLYSHKREEARITDALDTTQILNVAIQEKPAVPRYPAQSNALFALLGTVLAITLSTGLVFAMERFDASFRTPMEVESVLNLPVLAAVPGRNGNGFHVNGNGNGHRTLPTEVIR